MRYTNSSKYIINTRILGRNVLCVFAEKPEKDGYRFSTLTWCTLYKIYVEIGIVKKVKNPSSGSQNLEMF